MSHVELKKRLLAAGWEQEGDWAEWSFGIERLVFVRDLPKHDRIRLMVFRAVRRQQKKTVSGFNRMGWDGLPEMLRLPKEVAAVLEHCC